MSAALAVGGPPLFMGATGLRMRYYDAQFNATAESQLRLPPPYTALTGPSTIFLQNRTWFVVASGDAGAAGLLGVPVFEGAAAVEGRVLAPLYSKCVDVQWDHVCNVVATVEGELPSHFWTLMVSEYDARVRPQVPFALEEGWRRVPGLSGMDMGSGAATGGPDAWNCGDECLVYALEAYDGAALPRRLVGRNFHTGAVATNVSDGLGLLTMSPLDPELMTPFAFVGLARRPPGGLQLVGYVPGAAGPTALAKVPIAGGAVEAAVRLGVLLIRGPGEARAQALVWTGGGVAVFDLRVAGGAVEASFNASRTLSTPAPDFWVPLPAW